MKRPLLFGSIVASTTLLFTSNPVMAQIRPTEHQHVTIPPAAPKTGTVRITAFDYYATTQQAAFDYAIKSFEQHYPTVKVTVDSVPGQLPALQKLITLESANQTPNVIVIDQDYMDEFYPKIIPLKTFFTPSFIAKFDAGGTTSATYAGVQYGLQVLGANDTALIYNKTDFKAAGIPNPPTTWAQLLTDAQKLTVHGRYGFGISGAAEEEASWQFEPFLWSNGGTFSKLNSPQSVQALTLYQQLIKDKSMPQATASWTQQDAENHFAVNDLAMEINGPWNVPCLQQPQSCLGGTGSSSAKVIKINYGVAPIPTRLPSQKLVVPIGGETWEIGQGSTAQEAASALLIQFLTDDTSVNVTATHQMGYMPAIKAETAAFDAKYPAYSVFASELKNGRPRQYKNGEYGQVSTLLWTAIGKVLTLSESPKAALDTAAAGVANIKPPKKQS